MNPVVIPWPADVACSRAATPWMRRATAFCSWRDACHWAPGPGSRAAEWGEDAPTQSSGDPRPRSPIAGAHLGRRAAAGGQRLRGRGPAGGGAAPLPGSRVPMVGGRAVPLPVPGGRGPLELLRAASGDGSATGTCSRPRATSPGCWTRRGVWWRATVTTSGGAALRNGDGGAAAAPPGYRYDAELGWY